MDLLSFSQSIIGKSVSTFPLSNVQCFIHTMMECSSRLDGLAFNMRLCIPTFLMLFTTFFLTSFAAAAAVAAVVHKCFGLFTLLFFLFCSFVHSINLIHSI